MPIYIRFFMVLSLVGTAFPSSDNLGEWRPRKRCRSGHRVVRPNVSFEAGYDADYDESDIQISVDKQEQPLVLESDVRHLDDDVALTLGLFGHVRVGYEPHPHKTLGQQYDVVFNAQAVPIQDALCTLLKVPVSDFVQKNSKIYQNAHQLRGVIFLQMGMCRLEDNVSPAHINNYQCGMIRVHSNGNDAICKQYEKHLNRLPPSSCQRILVWLATFRQLLKEQQSIVERAPQKENIVRVLQESYRLERVAQRWSKAFLDISMCFQAREKTEQDFLSQQVVSPINYIQDYLGHEATHRKFMADYDPVSAWKVRTIVQDFHNRALTSQQRQARSNHRHQEGPTRAEIVAYERDRFGE